MFQKLYVCFHTCKRDFLNRYRPIIGLDGCHLKEARRGQLLSAIERDENDDIVFIAWTIVEAKNEEGWIQFLTNLLEDIGIEKEGDRTFILDRWKVLILSLLLLSFLIFHKYILTFVLS